MSAHSSRSTKERIVLTGGPGAGKTAVLELARRELARYAEVLPESELAKHCTEGSAP